MIAITTRLSIFLMVLWSNIITVALAVDRSKFRTCQQTSFCRRHRSHRRRDEYYKLDPHSLTLHTPSHNTTVSQEQQQANHEDRSIWSSLSRKLLGHSSDQRAVLDPYLLGPPPVLTGHLVLHGAKSAAESHDKLLQLAVLPLHDGTVRVRVTESYGHKGTAYEQARVTYDELVLTTTDWHVASHAQLHHDGDVLTQLGLDPQNNAVLEYGSRKDDHDSSYLLVLQFEPFLVSLYRGANLAAGPVVQVGGDGLYYEVRRRFQDGKNSDNNAKVNDDVQKENEDNKKGEEKEIVGYWEDGLAIYADGTREEKKEVNNEAEEANEQHRKLTLETDEEGLWEEKFGAHTDSKPYGPMSVGLNVRFPQSRHLYGLPEHAAAATLQSTMGDENSLFTEPYRLYNLDVFEYELNEVMALYGHVPLVVSQSVQTGTAGVFWFNPTETFVDVTKDSTSSTTTRWMSESGIIDVFIMPGPDPSSLYKQYATLTGTAALPPLFALGYHQCRWNYKDEKDVYQVHDHFEQLDYPYDVLWLDIEHTDGKRYFTWDDNNFPNPEEMQHKLAAQGRRMVTIIDPHIKRDDNYYIHRDASAKGLYIKENDGKKDFDGWCWPGSSSYLDFTDANVRQWWAEQFSFGKYRGSTPTLFTWNDMNEPSVFNGPEVSMQKDLRNLKGEEHREWHNLYGMLFHRATAEGQVYRTEQHDVRPFVLSRAFFAGSQKYGAIWTGDNTAEWGHLEIAAPMLLSMNVAALSFVGADVGGFFGNPDAELFTRWYQAAAYQPFFRGHAHHDAKRREPWMFDDATLHRLRRAAMARYALLPHWYTLFRQAEITGMPVMRMMWMQYPHTEALFAVDDQYMVGADLLVKPVTKAGATEVEVQFPTNDVWYNAETLTKMPLPTATKPHSVDTKVVPADIDIIPVYQRGGSILARKLRLRRSSMTMKRDPYTLYVALAVNGTASGQLYMDDEETFGYQKRDEHATASFSFDLSAKRMTCVAAVAAGWTTGVASRAADRTIERIIIVGLDRSPKSITARVGTEAAIRLEFQFSSDSKLLVIRKPEVSALQDWQLTFTF